MTRLLDLLALFIVSAFATSALLSGLAGLVLIPELLAFLVCFLIFWSVERVLR